MRLVRNTLIAAFVAAGCAVELEEPKTDELGSVALPDLKADAFIRLRDLGPLRAGEVSGGEFTENREYHVYTIEALAGGSMAIEVLEDGSTPDLDTIVWVLPEREDDVLAVDDDGGARWLSRIDEVIFPADGIYRAVVGTYTGTGRGHYRVLATCLSEPCGTTAPPPPPPAGECALDTRGPEGSISCTSASTCFAGACPPTHRWSLRAGTSVDDGAMALAADRHGHVFIAGTDTDSGWGQENLVIASYDSVTATLRWSQRIWMRDDGSAHAIAVDGEGHVYVAGACNGEVDFGGGPTRTVGAYQDTLNVFVASYDGATGVHRWSRRFTPQVRGAAWATAMVIDPAGNLYVAGNLNNAASLSVGGATLTAAGGMDAFVASYVAATGGHRWSRALGGPLDDAASAVAVGGDGTVYVTGSFQDSAGFGGDLLTAAGERDAFVVGFASATGAHRWSRRVGADGHDYGLGVAADAEGNAYVGVRSAGADFGGGMLEGFVVASYDRAGAHRWSRSIAPDADDFAAMLVDPAGDLYVAGPMRGSPIDFGGGALASPASRDMFVASYDTAGGGHRWSWRAFGTVGDDSAARGVAVDDDGNVYVTGTFRGRIDLGGERLVSAGGYDMALASLRP